MTELSSVTSPDRLCELQRLRLTDASPEPQFDRLTALASRLLEAPVALVSLVDDRRQFFKSCLGLPEPWATHRETPLSHSFCKLAVETAAELVVPDSREHEILRDNGAVKDLGVIAYLGIPIFSSQGKCLGSFCVIDGVVRNWTEEQIQTMRDLTRCVESEIELRSQLLQTQELSRRKSDFLAQLSHELRNPLSPMLSGLQMLCDDQQLQQEDPQTHQLHGILLEQTQQVVHLVDDLLDLSRIEQGKLSVQRQPVNLVEVINSAARMLEAPIRSKSQTLQVNHGVNHCYILGDYQRLVQVITNLLSNACRYTPAGGEIRVCCQIQGNQALVTVQDNGPGIPQEQHQSIFGLFDQGEFDRRPNEGLGIGLALVKQLVEQHDGQVSLLSQCVPGACFQVRLPLLPIDVQASPSANTPRETTPDHAADTSDTTELTLDVLLVDDQRAILFVLGRVLEKLGCHVRSAQNVDDAWAEIRESTPDLIFSDLEMPEVSGYQFIQAVRAIPEYAQLPVVAMTGNSAPDDVDRCCQAGFDHVLCKPVNVAAIRQVLAKLKTAAAEKTLGERP